MEHVPASHRVRQLEVVSVRGGLYSLGDEDDDGVGATHEGEVDDVIDALRKTVASPPERGFVIVHTPPLDKLCAGDDRSPRLT